MANKPTIDLTGTREHRDRGLSKRDRIDRLHSRVKKLDAKDDHLVPIILGILDLLADEL